MTKPKHTLVIGGTARARRLATRLARRERVTYSLAGVTENPRLPQGCTVRRGPFGGVEGLIAYLHSAQIDRVLDASHPHAAGISENVQRACLQGSVPLLRLRWRPWQAEPGDVWRHFQTTDSLCAALAAHRAERVFLALGVKASAPLMAVAGHHYLLRTVEAPDPAVLSADVTVVRARGPFDAADEYQLLSDHRINLIVCKNSGLPQGRAKLDAARRLGIEVWLLDASSTEH